MDLKKIITELAEQCIENEETFLVEVIIAGKAINQKIQVFIDGDKAVGIDECSNMSRKLSDLLEEKNLIEGNYTIEVSSPGVSKSLKFIRQYPKHKGRELEIILKDKTKYTGILKDVGELEIMIEIHSGAAKKERQQQTVSLPVDQVESAKVLVRF